MNIQELIRKLQTPNRGSMYQDEKMLQQYIDNMVAIRTGELTDQLTAANNEIAALTKVNHKLDDQLSIARAKIMTNASQKK